MLRGEVEQRRLGGSLSLRMLFCFCALIVLTLRLSRLAISLTVSPPTYMRRTSSSRLPSRSSAPWSSGACPGWALSSRGPNRGDR